MYLAFKLRWEGTKVLHAHLIGAVFAGALAGLMARLPVIGTLHDGYSIRENPNARLMLPVQKYRVARGPHCNGVAS